MSRYSRPRKPGLVTLPELPEHVRKFVEQNESMKNMRDAWEAHDKAMLLSDNDAKLADQAFVAVRALRPRKKL